MTRFRGLNALVTGGAGGIGAATAVRLAEEGAHVVVADFDAEGARRTAEAIGGTAMRCDVTSREDVEAAVAAAVARGSLDILVTAAGIIRDNPVAEMTDEQWDAVIDTHLNGTFYAVRAAQQHMVEQGSGKIVLFSSRAALGSPGRVNYVAAKAGVQGMTKTLAIELGPFGINVNAVAPGFISTAMTELTADQMGIPFAELQRSIAAKVPLRRVGEPEDVAGVIAFLCSNDASYVSGQVIYIRGGPEGSNPF